MWRNLPITSLSVTTVLTTSEHTMKLYFDFKIWWRLEEGALSLLEKRDQSKSTEESKKLVVSVCAPDKCSVIFYLNLRCWLRLHYYDICTFIAIFIACHNTNSVTCQTQPLFCRPLTLKVTKRASQGEQRHFQCCCEHGFTSTEKHWEFRNRDPSLQCGSWFS